MTLKEIHEAIEQWVRENKDKRGAVLFTAEEDAKRNGYICDATTVGHDRNIVPAIVCAMDKDPRAYIDVMWAFNALSKKTTRIETQPKYRKLT